MYYLRKFREFSSINRQNYYEKYQNGTISGKFGVGPDLQKYSAGRKLHLSSNSSRTLQKVFCRTKLTGELIEILIAFAPSDRLYDWRFDQ